MRTDLKILRTVIFRKWVQEPILPLVLIIIIAVGVATFFSVRLANRAAVSGFNLFTESLTGESDLTIRSPSGFLQENKIIEISKVTGSLPIHYYPVIETSAFYDSQLMKIIGIDLISLANLSSISSSSASLEIGTLNEESIDFVDSAFLPEKFLESKSLAKNDSFKIRRESFSYEFKIKGSISNSPFRPSVPPNLVLMDLKEAQKVGSFEGKVTRIDAYIPEGPLKNDFLKEAKLRLQKWASNNNSIVDTSGDQKKAITQMSSAFRLNLTVLSCLALMVGTFFILQSMEASVIRRRKEIAILRSLGVTPKKIFRIWLTESFIIGIIGSILGIILGFFFAQGVVRGVVSTVNQLYYEITSSGASMNWGEALMAIIFGVVVCLIAGYLPSREAAKVQPAAATQSGIKGGGSLLFLTPKWGFTLLLLGCAFSFIPPITINDKSIAIGGYLSALFFVVGWSMFCTILFPIIAKKLPGSPSSLYAKSQFRRPKGRHRLATAALVSAFGMSSAMGILISSFDKTLNSWINQVLKADVYIASSRGNASSANLAISSKTWSQFTNETETEGMDLLRQIRITFRDNNVWLAGTERNNQSERKLELTWIIQPENNNLEDGQAWISEPLMRKFSIKRGHSIEIPTPEGFKNLIVKGVYADYSNETGTIMVNRRFIKEFYKDNSITNAAIYLKPDMDPDIWVNLIQSKFPEIFVRTNKNLRADSLKIFKQTFSVTYALEAIAILIAVTGLGLTMTGLLLERKKELENLRQIGTTRNEIAKSAMYEGLTLSIIGSLGGIALSLCLGWLLIYRINVQSFGWTLSQSIPFQSIFLLAILMLSIGAAVSWFVGKNTCKRNII
tara:strand:+ start:1450 stop:3987 length:2538 start_codon:yes stop_codon:yes gene_type:complete